MEMANRVGLGGQPCRMLLLASMLSRPWPLSLTAILVSDFKDWTAAGV